MTRGTLEFGGNTVKVWVETREDGIFAGSVRPKDSLHFANIADKYRADIIPLLKPASQASIDSVLAILCKTFGARSLASIETEDIQRFVSSSPYSPKTIKNRVGVMRMVWNKARAWGYVKHDPFEFLSMPRSPLTEARTLSVDEIRAIIRKTDEPYKTMLMILAETGMRGGELCGLYRSDISGGQISIARSAFRKQIQTPKTGNAVRSVAISGRLAEHLSSFCGSAEGRAEGNDAGARNGIAARENSYGAESSKCAWQESSLIPCSRVSSLGPQNLLFAMPDGRPWHNGEILRRLKPVLGSGVGLHTFRHANKSLMQSLGVPEYIQDERMGHAKQGISGRYTHSSPEDHRRWAEIIGQACTENGRRASAGGD